MQRNIQIFQKNVQHIVATLKAAKERKKKAKENDKACTLLIGAGCSKKAGIPLACEFVELISKKFSYKYEQVEEKTYPHCMAELNMAERRDLISKFIDEAQINWAHIGIAQLIKNDFVDRVLTVNFDPLIQKACAMVGVFPAVYDFAASQYFNPSFIADRSIFHLHGQRSGFVILNTAAEVKKLSRHLKPLFDEALRGRVCIVVGYSGENDPVFKHLAAIQRFDNNLYWVGYEDADPAEHVRNKLLKKGKDAFYVPGFDADDFFVTLAQKLDCFPPDFVGKPFSHLLSLISDVRPYSLPGQNVRVADSTAALINSAIESFEKGGAKTTAQHSLALQANDLLLAGKYDEVIAMSSKSSHAPKPELADLIAGAYLALGNEQYNRALKRSGKEANRLFAQSLKMYAAATRINPDKHEAFNDWGIALQDQAVTKSGKEADQLFAQSWKKYETATKIKPDFHAAFYNWGNTLLYQASTKSGKEADHLFAEACTKYKTAATIKPDKHWAFNNWGIALSGQAVTKSGKEADDFFAQAYEKYETATKIKPDLHEAFRNWGIALSDQAKTKSGKEADRLKALAEEKFETARELKANPSSRLV